MASPKLWLGELHDPLIRATEERDSRVRRSCVAAHRDISRRLESRSGIDKIDGYPCAGAAGRLNVQFRLGVFAKGLHDQRRAEFAFRRPTYARRKANAVVGHDDAITISFCTQAFQRDGASVAVDESIFERVGEKL